MTETIDPKYRDSYGRAERISELLEPILGYKLGPEYSHSSDGYVVVVRHVAGVDYPFTQRIEMNDQTGEVGNHYVCQQCQQEAIAPISNRNQIHGFKAWFAAGKVMCPNCNKPTVHLD